MKFRPDIVKRKINKPKKVEENIED